MLTGKVTGVFARSGGGYRRYFNLHRSNRASYVTMSAKYYLLVELENGITIDVLAEQKSRNQSFEVIEATKKRLENQFLGKEVQVKFGCKEYLI